MSKYIALYNDLSHISWPSFIKEEYFHTHSKDEYYNMNHGEAAVWMGTWLYHHINTIPVLEEIDSSLVKSGQVYRYVSSNIFIWFDETSSSNYDNLCKVTVEEIPDNIVWTIECDDMYCREFIKVYSKPDKNGFLTYMSRKEWEEDSL